MPSESFESYQNLMIELHKLFKAGEDDEKGGEKGDEIRDRMDVLWYSMSELERVHIEQLSKFLYEQDK